METNARDRTRARRGDGSDPNEVPPNRFLERYPRRGSFRRGSRRRRSTRLLRPCPTSVRRRGGTTGTRGRRLATGRRNTAARTRRAPSTSHRVCGGGDGDAEVPPGCDVPGRNSRAECAGGCGAVIAQGPVRGGERGAKSRSPTSPTYWAPPTSYRASPTSYWNPRRCNFGAARVHLAKIRRPQPPEPSRQLVARLPGHEDLP